MRPPAEAIASLGWFVGAIAFVILAGVEGALIWAAWRYRASRVPGPAPQIHGNTRLEIAWTAIPLVVLAVVFVLMLGTMREISGAVASSAPPSGVPDLRVLARGYQWWWEYRYTTASGEVVAANELHIPVGVSVDLALEAHDVIHSFWVPELNGKTDMIPGHTNHLRLYAPRAGAYSGQCAEFCGLEHAWMRISVIADEPADFARWLAAQSAPRLPPSGAVAEAGERVFTANVCASCHTIRGTGAAGLAGPDLTHVGSRRTLGTGVLANDDAGMRAWIADPQRYKPGVFMPQVPLSAADLTALVAYLRSLQ
ncbi:MAG TPA: cytochrome c oxidase subunit II [Methylomirabilota bacterium]|nr:cytochrome c oxidase subunit II [Methylomirabilota bacterium]